MTEPLPEFHLPESQNYHCIQCGRSCGMFMEVPIEPRSETRLGDYDLKSIMPEEIREKAPFHVSPIADERRVILRHAGTCAFQCDDGLCGIHKKWGYDTKPQTCRDFPYRFVETPGGVYVGLSYACTAAQENLGPPVTDQLDELKSEYPVANSRRGDENPVRLSNRHEVSWQAYVDLERDLDSVLTIGDYPFAERLVAKSAYLDLYIAFLREIRGDTGGSETKLPSSSTGRFAGDSGRSSDVDVLNTLRQRFMASEAKELFRLAGRTRGSLPLQRAFLGMITAFRQHLYIKGKRPTRIGTAVGISHHYLRHALKLGSIKLDALKSPFQYKALETIRFDPDGDDALHEMIERFFRHMLFRKDLLLEESVWLAQRLNVMHFALIRWHAIGRASLAGRDTVELEDLREAIRDVELQYIFHTTFGKLFEKLPSLGMILDALIRRPVFAASMAKG